MSNPNTTIIQLVAAVANGVCLAQQPAGAGLLTLNGSLVTSGVGVFDVARRVVTASSGADAGIILTIVGTDRYGNSQTEAVTMVSSPAVAYTNRDFKTVTSVSASAATAANVTVGTNAVASSEWVPDDFRSDLWGVGGGITSPAGTTYTLETTFDDPNKTGTSLVASQAQFSLNPMSFVPPKAWPHAVIVNASGDSQFNFSNDPCFAHRVTVTAGTGQVVMQTIQAAVGSGR